MEISDQKFIDSLGLSLEVSAPKAQVDEGGWVHVAFEFKLFRFGKFVTSGPYKMGTGHFSDLKLSPGCQSSVAWGIKKRGWEVVSKFKTEADKKEALGILQSVVEGKTAFSWGFALTKKKPKTRVPELSEVLGCLVLDGSPAFDAETFESWAENFGMDVDSRSALKMFGECVETGNAIRRSFSESEIQRLREIEF